MMKLLTWFIIDYLENVILEGAKRPKNLGWSGVIKLD